ncbi:hypothetical protein Pla123a_22940 [Posidoniimonas polymericola]|uniref:Uncharacterized protein n=1 Tax=Posidoniimonas polymericola TaxID=2528002 RepID=A0A5C5YQ29_9BACT|nr:hypothetical protein [Posidoniimonas polymericola]TWT76870.1 hypothetical protein Pla123a_22940 [Posidoniimonas polymericola]
MPLWRLLILCAVLLAPQPTSAEPALLERYDGPTTTWNPVPNRFGVRVLQHERVRQDSQHGTGAELVRLTGPPGYSGMLLTPIGRAPILEDLSVQVRLRCDHPGVQLALRVVLPREVDQRTGLPVKAIVRGDARARGTHEWEDLTLDQTPTAVRRHARAIGSTVGHSIDWSGAYADAVVLIVPCDPRGASLWVDELAISGLIQTTANEGADPAGARKAIAQPRTVRLSQEGLFINDRPFYPRIITHYGEPLEELRKLGFNTIAFETPPTGELRRDCSKLGLQAICPPPGPDVLSDAATAVEWDVALAWLLPQRTDQHSLDSTMALADSLRQSDATLARPLIAWPVAAWSSWSRLADGLVVESPWSAPERMLSGCQGRIAEATRFGRPGAPLFAAIPLSHSDQFVQQVTSFAPAGTVDAWRSPSEVAVEAMAAATDGARGIWVTRGAPLTNAESDNRVRQGMALLNLNLTLLEPWLRDGQRAGEISAQQPGYAATVMTRGRTRLLIPQPADEQTRPSATVTYVTPGVAEAAKAYEFTPVGMRPLPLSRLAGGAHVTTNNPAAWLLITEDTRSAAEVSQRVRSVARRAGALQEAIAISELRHAEAHLSPLVMAAGSNSPDAAVLADARRKISAAKSAQSAGAIDAAFAHAAAATNQLASWSRGRVATARSSQQLDSSPLAAQASTIIDHHRLLQLIEPLVRRDNLLPGGDFEDHGNATASGWRHTAREDAGGAAVVSFSGDQPAEGTRCLRIECPAGEQTTPATTLVEIDSPEVNVNAGGLYEITGQVRVEQASGQGALVVSDNLGGEELSLVIDRPSSWRPFRLLRRATTDTQLRLRFAAVGPVTAELDAVMIRPVELPTSVKAAVLGAPALQRK